jgi:hypothetical protein
MAQIRKRLVGGEILEVPVGDRFGYVQFLGEHREYGEAILVSPKLHDRVAHFATGFFSTGYVTFYPAAFRFPASWSKSLRNLRHRIFPSVFAAPRRSAMAPSNRG